MSCDVRFDEVTPHLSKSSKNNDQGELVLDLLPLPIPKITSPNTFDLTGSYGYSNESNPLKITSLNSINIYRYYLIKKIKNKKEWNGDGEPMTS